MSDLPGDLPPQDLQARAPEGALAPRDAAALAPLRHADESRLPTGFEPWRARLDALRGMELLDALIAPLNAAACVQTLPAEDLHRYIFEVGLEDCDQVLALASGEQVRALIDMEGWEGHLPSLPRLDAWLNALLRAGAEVLYERMKELDDELLSWVLQQNTYAFVVEEPEDFIPPDAPHLLTPDRRFCVVYPREEDHDAPARMFVDLYMQESPEQCITFLLGASGALPSIIEEEAYRWRSARMSERGFVPREEALEIYARPPADWRAALPARVNEEAPPARRWLAQVVAPDARLDAAFAALGPEEALAVGETLGYVANMIFSADRVELWDAEAQRAALRRLRAGLHIALEELNGLSAPAALDASLLAHHHLNYLFRVGYERMVDAARPVWRVEGALRRGDDAAGALSDLPRVRPLAEALLGEHPEGQRGAPLQTLADCRLAREGAELVADLVGVSQRLRAALLAARANDPALEPAVVSWWRALGGATTTAPLALLSELREQVGAVDAARLDPRFTPLLWVEGVTPAPRAALSAARRSGGALEEREGEEREGEEHLSLDDEELTAAGSSEALYYEGLDDDQDDQDDDNADDKER